ncbi:MAG: diacylglycerol/lipid kinase family protein [Bacillota bacterium]
MKTSPTRVCVILNPVAGRGKAKLAAQHLVNELGKFPEVNFELWESTSAGEPLVLARKALTSHFSMVIAVGGDGTVGEVVNGLLQSESPCAPVLGVMPAGTGNDFAIGAGMPATFRESAASLSRAVLGSRTRFADVIEVRDASGKTLFAVNSVGIGFDAAVARAVKSTQLNKVLGRLSYAYCVYKCLSSFRTFPLELTTLGASSPLRIASCWLVACTNTERLGGGIKINPGASPFDGAYDVCVGHSVPAVKLALLLPLAFAGLHRHFAGVSFLRCASATFFFPAGTPLHIDGDPIDLAPPITLTAVTSRLRLLVPQG